MKKHSVRLLSVTLILVLFSSVTALADTVYQADSTPPAEVTDVSSIAGDGYVTITWTDPADGDFAKVKITGAGRTVYVGKGIQTVTFSGLVNDVQYSFRISTVDSSGNLSVGVLIFEMAKDSTPPEQITGLTAEIVDNTILFKWIDPDCEDLDRIVISGNNNIYNVDKGIQYLAIGDLTEDSYGTYTFYAVDLTGNESSPVQIVVEAEATAIILDGPATVKPLEGFIVQLGLKCTRNDVYAAQIHLNYDADKFEYTGYREFGNHVHVALVETTTEGELVIFTFSNQPITGDNTPMILLDFSAKEGTYTEPGTIAVSNAMVGTAPDGYSIPAATAAININIAAITVPDVSKLSITPGNKQVILTWEDPEYEDLDHISISGDGFGPVLVPKGVQKATITNLTNGTTYSFTVKAVDRYGNQSPGVTISGTPSGEDTTPPGEVTNLRIIPGDGNLTLKWTDPTDPDFYSVIISGVDITPIEIAKGNQQAMLENLENGKLYTLTVKTKDASGNKSIGLTISGRPRKSGDVNYDGAIDVADLAIAVYYYRVKEGDPLWELASACDVTGPENAPDGIVDILDLAHIAREIIE
jgi:hypothetical protein